MGDLRGWDVGSKIVVTSTSYGDGSCRLDRQDRCQPEEREIQTIDTLHGDGFSARITFGEPLRYKHWGESTPVPGSPNGKTVERRAEVMLLTRNINVRGTTEYNGQDLLQFENNTAHSNGAAGLWIHGIKHTSHGMYQKMILKNTLSWNNGGFGFSVLPGVGHVQIISGIAMGNSIDIAYTKEIYAQSWATGDSDWNGNLVLNTTLRGDPDRATQAIGGPHGAWITFRDVLISSYTSKRPPIAHCRICPSWKGGMEVRFAQMKIFDSTPATKGGIRALVQWGGYHGNILYDMDGSLTNSSGGRYVHSLKGVRPVPGKQKPTGHFPPKHCSKNPFVDGVACDADQVSMRELQFNCLGAGMYLSTASDQRAPYIPFSQYDAIGRRKYCHVTGVFVKHPNATPVIHEFDWAAGQSRKSPYYRPKSTAHPFSGEIREMRQNEWAIIRFLAWENPCRWYSIRDGILSGDPLNKYNQ